MAQSLRRISGEVKHVSEFFFFEKRIHERSVLHGTLYKLRSLRDVLQESTGEVVKDNDTVSGLDEPLRYMRADEPCTACDKNIIHFYFLLIDE